MIYQERWSFLPRAHHVKCIFSHATLCCQCYEQVGDISISPDWHHLPHQYIIRLLRTRQWATARVVTIWTWLIVEYYCIDHSYNIEHQQYLTWRAIESISRSAMFLCSMGERHVLCFCCLLTSVGCKDCWLKWIVMTEFFLLVKINCSVVLLVD